MATDALAIRPLTAIDHAAWEPLWLGYLDFYETKLDAAMIALTWQRLLDPAEPMHVLGAFQGEEMVGIVHYLYHRSTWTPGPYCYLQDLFTRSAERGQGIGRRLIAAVEEVARAAGASRVYWLTHETNISAQGLYNKLAERPGFIQYRICF